LIGFLVDRLLEPAVTSPDWSALAPILGNQPGAGMRLVLISAGLIMLLGVLTLAALPNVRRLEALLPDYKAVEE
jgi:MFS transporter, DHA3 family, macrolide efflux protein